MGTCCVKLDRDKQSLKAGKDFRTEGHSIDLRPAVSVSNEDVGREDKPSCLSSKDLD